jgi:hypothetical protein
LVGTAKRTETVLAGVSNEVMEKSAAGMKLISETQPSWVDANFRRLCDLRSREVCLYRAPVISRD